MDSDITEVDVDVFKDGAWVDVFQGGNESDWNCKWVELTFPKGTVTKARFRYNYKRGGFYYWLYEFQFYETSLTVSPPTCTTQNATSVEENTAVLSGLVVNDGGEPCQYQFQYGKTAAYGTNTGWKSDKKITGDIFNELVSGLDDSSEYHFQAQLKNSVGTTNCLDKKFTTAPAGTGWDSPTGYTDPDNKWGDETAAYDNNTITYTRSYHNIGDPQWSSFIYFTHPSIVSDDVRFYARGGSQVSSVDVDVFKDGVWIDVYQGAFNDKQWIEESFEEGKVTQARIRFYATNSNEGFFWELYEFNFQKVVETSTVSCLDLSAYLVSDYITSIPYDPTTGSSERTYYAVRKSSGGMIVVESCSPELGEEIIAH
jgi:hypothetical protein